MLCSFNWSINQCGCCVSSNFVRFKYRSVFKLVNARFKVFSVWPLHLVKTLSLLITSLGAHSASQLTTSDIRKTGKGTTGSFHNVQQGAILVSSATGNVLCILINTDEVTLLLVAIILSHQVPMIFLGPSSWTVIPCGHHQHWTTWADVANNARCFMVMEILLLEQIGDTIDFIFSAIHAPRALITVFVVAILWSVWKA